MTKRQHLDLSKAFERNFPKLFNFEHCGILFVCAITGNLQKFIYKDDSKEELSEVKKEVEEKNIVRCPKDIGCTGQAIIEKRVVKF